MSSQVLTLDDEDFRSLMPRGGTDVKRRKAIWGGDVLGWGRWGFWFWVFLKGVFR